MPLLPHDPDTIPQEYIATALLGNTTIAALVGTNTVTGDGQVYYWEAPREGVDINYPYIVFWCQSAGSTPIDGVGPFITAWTSLWSVKTVGPPGLHDAAKRVNQLVGATLHATQGPTSEGYVITCEVDHTMLDAPEVVDNRNWFSRGMVFRLLSQSTAEQGGGGLTEPPGGP